MSVIVGVVAARAGLIVTVDELAAAWGDWSGVLRTTLQLEMTLAAAAVDSRPAETPASSLGRAV